MPLMPTPTAAPMKSRAPGLGGGAPAVVQKGGLFPGAESGRADTMKATVPEGTYILPADVVSALGDGNTLAGAKLLDARLKQDSQAKAAPPAAPAGLAGFADGGAVQGAPVPILASGGEYRIMPSAVAALGGGNIEDGFKILDKFVSQIRDKHVKKVKSLPEPKK